MDIVCTSCNKTVGEVEAVARLILTVHCPFDGTDFGVTVEPPAPAAGAPVPDTRVEMRVPGLAMDRVPGEWLPNTGKPWFGPPQ